MRTFATRILGAACASAPSPAAPATPAPSDQAPPAPTVTTSPIDGPQLQALLTTPPAKVQVVNLWASWCAPCLRELPHLVAYARAHPNIEVVLVNVDAPVVQPHKVVPLLEQRGYSGVIHRLLSADNPVAALNEHVADFPGAIPVTTVVDLSGTRTRTWVEELPMAELDEAVRAAASTGAAEPL